MKIIAYICPICNYAVFSRARHDFRGCNCGEISVDGGFDYARIGFKDKAPETIELDLGNVDKRDLYIDYYRGENKYGLFEKEVWSKIIINKK